MTQERTFSGAGLWPGVGAAMRSRHKPRTQVGLKIARYPRVLLILAAVFVAATFLNAIHISDNPLAENPMNVAGLALAGAFVLLRGLSARVWSGPARYAWLFFGVTAVLELGRFLLDRSGAGASSLRSYAQYVQALGVYFIFYDLARDRKAAAIILRVFLWSVILLSLVANLGLAGAVGATALGRGMTAERVGVLGMNLNYQGFLYAAALTGILCHGLARWPRFGMWEWILAGGAASVLLALLRTGSRSALVVLVAGVAAALALMFRGRRWAAYALMVPVVLYGIGSAIMSSEVIRARVEATLYEGDYGARDVLARETFEMLRERPWTGWGASYSDELGLRTGRIRIAAHNTYLQVAASFGLTGFLPWALGLGVVGWRLWTHRQDFWAATQLAIWGTLLVVMLVGNYGYHPTSWILLALAGAMPFGPLPAKRLRPGATPAAGSAVRRRLPGRATPQRSGAGIAG